MEYVVANSGHFTLLARDVSETDLNSFCNGFFDGSELALRAITALYRDVALLRPSLHLFLERPSRFSKKFNLLTELKQQSQSALNFLNVYFHVYRPKRLHLGPWSNFWSLCFDSVTSTPAFASWDTSAKALFVSMVADWASADRPSPRTETQSALMSLALSLLPKEEEVFSSVRIMILDCALAETPADLNMSDEEVSSLVERCEASNDTELMFALLLVAPSLRPELCNRDLLEQILRRHAFPALSSSSIALP
eukprot:TRINITY_DN2110_c0_g1_i2.p1 TRINITY_DN2110_c0_g1~~TRINITY_DN2110_c0_g1_i2.p1  ORF type:complete len:252 (-),score=25.00 TRINITY_DN2110_c0_g1_i2:476-1231(-)